MVKEEYSFHFLLIEVKIEGDEAFLNTREEKLFFPKTVNDMWAALTGK